MLTVVAPLILDVLVTAKVTAVKFELVETSPFSPQATTTLDGIVSVREDESHLTQQDTKNGNNPLGRLGNNGVDTYDPLVITKAVFGNEVELEKYEMPFELTISENAATPSDCDPER